MHKIFLSYRHENEKHGKYDDYLYKRQLDKLFDGVYINKSVMNGEYDPDNSDAYIKRLIREDKVSDSSVVIVLCGPETWSRKHIDWEIYAGLAASINGASGLIGVFLPNHPNYGSDKFTKSLIPPRLLDNFNSGYAKLYDWDYFVANHKQIIEDAFSNRIILKDKIDNSRLQMKYNRSLD